MALGPRRRPAGSLPAEPLRKCLDVGRVAGERRHERLGALEFRDVHAELVVGPGRGEVTDSVDAVERVADGTQPAEHLGAVHELCVRQPVRATEWIRIPGERTGLAHACDLGGPDGVGVQHLSDRVRLARALAHELPGRGRGERQRQQERGSRARDHLPPPQHRDDGVQPEQRRRADRDRQEHRHRDAAAEQPAPAVGGNHREEPHSDQRHPGHRREERGDAVLQVATFVGVEATDQVDDQHRRERGERPRDAGAVDQRRPEARVEEAGPHRVRGHPSARRELPRQDAVDQEQARPGGHGIRREQRDPRPVREALPVAVEEVPRHDLEQEEAPLGGPDPVELLDHLADRRRADLHRRQPHADAGQGPEHERHQDEEHEEPVEEPARDAIAATGEVLEPQQQGTRADRELRDEHVHDAHAADHHAWDRRAELRHRVHGRVLHRVG